MTRGHRELLATEASTSTLCNSISGSRNGGTSRARLDLCSDISGAREKSAADYLPLPADCLGTCPVGYPTLLLSKAAFHVLLDQARACTCEQFHFHSKAKVQPRCPLNFAVVQSYIKFSDLASAVSRYLMMHIHHDYCCKSGTVVVRCNAGFFPY